MVCNCPRSCRLTNLLVIPRVRRTRSNPSTPPKPLCGHVQPVFKFSTTTLTNVSHVGMPDAWDFPWVGINWGPSPLL